LDEEAVGAEAEALTSPGTRLRLKMDEGAGQSVSDASPYGNNGTLGLTTAVEQQDPAWATGVSGSGLSFDRGYYRFVDVPGNGSLEPDHVSVEAWIWTSYVDPSAEYIVSKGGDAWCGSAGGSSYALAFVDNYLR